LRAPTDEKIQLIGMDRFDSFSRLASALGELEVTVGPAARPVIAEIRDLLIKGAAAQGNSDQAAAVAALGRAMERLAALAATLDPAEGMLMRLIAERFAQSLRQGDKATAKETINLMRHRAGDPKDDPDTEW
jgi:hypothetical protein